MRVTVLIIGLLLGAVMFVQTFLVNLLGQAGDQQGVEQAGAVGLMMSLLWLIACAFVLPLPFVSVVMFLISGVVGFASSAEFPDLAVWGGISLVLAALSFFGWLGKRKERRQFKIERARQEERDARMETILHQQSRTVAPETICPSCNRTNAAGTRFCGNCGTALSAA